MTWISYQSIPCLSVKFRRSRGYQADTTQVVILADALAQLSVSDAINLNQRPKVKAEDLSALALVEPKAGSPPTPSSMDYEGTLVMAERIAGKTYKVEVGGLVVVAIDTVEEAEEGTPKTVALTLVDERYFSARGVLRTWRFNQRLPNGEFDLSTLKPDGKPRTTSEIAQEVVSRLWRNPKLSNLPKAWEATQPPDPAFPAFSTAIGALAKMITDGGAEPPCLRLDGDFAIYLPGEGKVAYAPGGKGPNAQSFPPGFLRWDGGRGQGDHLGLNHPEEFVLVAGSQRVATVALDDAEPVIMVQGIPFLLSEQLVRQLTGGKHGLRWVEKIVMLSKADQGSISGVPDDVVKVLAEQGYRKWRVRGVERIENGFYTAVPGPNAHLAPILARAETVGGKRVAPTVEAYTFETKRRKFTSSAAGQALAAANKSIDVLRTEIAGAGRKAGGIGDFDPFSGSIPGYTRLVSGDSVDVIQSESNPLSLRPLPVEQLVPPKVPPGIDRNRLVGYLNVLRRLRKADAKNKALANKIRKALKDRAKARDQLGPGDDLIILELAEKLVEREKKAAEGTISDLKGEYQDQFGDQSKSDAERAAAKARAARNKTRTRDQAGIARGRIESAVFLKNLRRAPVSTSAESLQLGVFSTPLLGHAEEEDVQDPSFTYLKPCPVRIVFGATLRPRVDAPPSTRPQTGGASSVSGSSAHFQALVDLRRKAEAGIGVSSSDAVQEAAEASAKAEEAARSEFERSGQREGEEKPRLECPGGQDVIPSVLGDTESYFSALFQRADGKAKLVRDVTDALLRRATRIARPDLRELIPLQRLQGTQTRQGLGNLPTLIQEAERVATAAFTTKKEIRTRRATIAGPWPVQTDGLVSSLSIESLEEQGAPCGFVTRITVGNQEPERLKSKIRNVAPALEARDQNDVP